MKKIYGGKLSLIYKENSHIFSLPIRVLLFVFKRRFIGQNRISAVIPTLEGGLLHKNKTVFNYFN
jgi:hypothetical protein